MNKELVVNFLSNLIDKTLNKNITWNLLIGVNINSLGKDNPNLYFSLLSNEWQTVKLSESYYTNVSNGTIFLIYIKVEGAVYSTVPIYEGFTLYIQKDSVGAIYKIDCDLNQLYQLNAAIQLCYSEKDMVAEEFMQAFLQES